MSFLPLKRLCGSGSGTDVWPGLQRMSPTHLSIPDTGGSRTDHTRCRRHDHPLSWEQCYQSLMITAKKRKCKKIWEILLLFFSFLFFSLDPPILLLLHGYKVAWCLHFHICSWSLSKLSQGKGRVTPWKSCQLIAGPTQGQTATFAHTHKYRQFSLAN